MVSGTDQARPQRHLSIMLAVRSRRLFAFIAALAVAWGSLWPLVSAAQPRKTVTLLVCTQSGFQQHIQVPVDDGGVQFHCPLCVVPVDVAPPAMPAPHAWIEVDAVLPAQRFVAAIHREFAARPPPSRAPP